jgi:hypothetical protein
MNQRLVQIGNAGPPLLAHSIAKELARQLKSAILSDDDPVPMVASDRGSAET